MRGVMKYFPHLAGSLVLASAGTIGMLTKWEPDRKTPEAYLTVYADKLANGLPTVCNGVTKHVSTIPVVVGEKWTDEMCREQEDNAIIKIQIQLASCFKHLPPQSVFDAAFDHAWNNGVQATCNSTSMTSWNRGNWLLGCNRLAYKADGSPNWAYVKTGKKLKDGTWEYKYVQGLHNRGVDRVKNCTKDL